MAYFVPNTYSTHQMIRYTFPLVNAFLQHYVSQENLNNFLTARARIFFFFFPKEEKVFSSTFSEPVSLLNIIAQLSQTKRLALFGKKTSFSTFSLCDGPKKTVFGGLINESKLGFSLFQNKFFVGLQTVFNRKNKIFNGIYRDFLMICH